MHRFNLLRYPTNTLMDTWKIRYTCAALGYLSLFQLKTFFAGVKSFVMRLLTWYGKRDDTNKPRGAPSFRCRVAKRKIFPFCPYNKIRLDKYIMRPGWLVLTDFFRKDTKPYPFDLSVCGSLTTLQSLQIIKKRTWVFITHYIIYRHIKYFVFHIYISTMLYIDMLRWLYFSYKT